MRDIEIPRELDKELAEQKEEIGLLMHLSLLLKSKDVKNEGGIDGEYLAGLIEGDGCIHVPKDKKGYPTISITFHINELPLWRN